MINKVRTNRSATWGRTQHSTEGAWHKRTGANGTKPWLGNQHRRFSKKSRFQV